MYPTQTYSMQGACRMWSRSGRRIKYWHSIVGRERQAWRGARNSEDNRLQPRLVCKSQLLGLAEDLPGEMHLLSMEAGWKYRSPLIPTVM